MWLRRWLIRFVPNLSTRTVTVHARAFSANPALCDACDARCNGSLASYLASLRLNALDGAATASVFPNFDASASRETSLPPRTCLGTKISTSKRQRGDFSASLMHQQENHSSIRASRSSRCVLTALTAYCISPYPYFFEFFSNFLCLPSTRRQQCFAGNSNSTTQSSDATTTDAASSSQISVTDAIGRPIRASLRCSPSSTTQRTMWTIIMPIALDLISIPNFEIIINSQIFTIYVIK